MGVAILPASSSRDLTDFPPGLINDWRLGGEASHPLCTVHMHAVPLQACFFHVTLLHNLYCKQDSAR